MKLLPYYLEDEGAKFSGAISLAQNSEVLSDDEALLISNYMSSCVVIDEWLSNVKDALTNKLEVPSKTWSDGVYVWDSLHIHYVKKYRARLPLEFVGHVKKQVAAGFDPKMLNIDDLSSEFEEILKKVQGDESYYDGSY
ncbi:MAG: hypothetical protein ABW168_26270 [Sedimenticola sp.]